MLYQGDLSAQPKPLRHGGPSFVMVSKGNRKGMETFKNTALQRPIFLAGFLRTQDIVFQKMNLNRAAP